MHLAGGAVHANSGPAERLQSKLVNTVLAEKKVDTCSPIIRVGCLASLPGGNSATECDGLGSL